MTGHPDAAPASEPEDSPATLFARLAGTVYASAAFDEVYQAICSAAPRLVSGCDRASLMLLANGRSVTAASTDETARHIDSLERQTGEGPCVDAIAVEAAELVSEISVSSPWPALSAQVLAQTPVRGAAAFRLVVDGRKLGALNLFSDTAGALTPTSADQGAVLAAFASVALSAVTHRQRADSLQQGLESNREIGQAVGLLRAFYKISSEEALERLRRTSQDLNIKMSEVARQVVEHQDRRP
jgi:transcriptional regulator with GAF, ATPase, and Fis domain